ncbi:MAG TPA: hypothetical protein VKV04_18125 [Verrucomicrobiae bacterium]|nr:hypothetical protein [Verrucomicrobiae bacterium]
MNTKTIIALFLIVAGIVVLAYSGITFKTPGQTVDFLGMHFQTTVSHFISPAMGAIALIAGVIMLIIKPGRI